MQGTENSDWTLVFTEEDDGLKSWQVRNEVPAELTTTNFSRSVIIEWPYADHGPPEKCVREQLQAFGELLYGLDNFEHNSLLVHVIKGGGVAEWCYYAKSDEKFMLDLNDALSGQPLYPIKILFDDDPTWKYWRGIKECIDVDS
jgi:Family of unknown function (DUF695)